MSQDHKAGPVMFDVRFPCRWATQTDERRVEDFTVLEACGVLVHGGQEGAPSKKNHPFACF